MRSNLIGHLHTHKEKKRDAILLGVEMMLELLGRHSQTILGYSELGKLGRDGDSRRCLLC